MRRWATIVAALALLLTGAAAPPGEDPHVSLVPWKVLPHGTTSDAPLTLYWIPASPDELRRSDLLTSSELTLFASRCVAMRVVRVDDVARLARLAPDDAALPLAVLTDRDGAIVGRVDSSDGVLSVSAVEAMVRDELDARTGAAESLLDEARERAERGDVDDAIAAYEDVWEQRCVCPRQGKDAERALKKLQRK